MRNSKIILSRGLKIDKNFNNVLTYSNSQMLDLMRSQDHLLYEGNNYSFISEFQNIINVQVPYDLCLTMNYMAFQNPRYGEKWFFCFIDKVEYNSEKSTNITFHVDSWATWYENINVLDCYTIREHVKDDSIGKHVTAEDLSVGAIQVMHTSVDAQTSTTPWVCVASNYDPENLTNYAGIGIYNRNVFGTKLFFFQYNTITVLEDLMKFILVTNADGFISSILNMFIIPRCFA